MSRSKYTMTNAAAKRITAVLQKSFEPTMYMDIKVMEQALADEGFTSFRSSHVRGLMDYWRECIEEGDKPNFHSHMMASVAERYVREYYEQRDGIDEMKGGMMRLGILPYPEDDA